MLLSDSVNLLCRPIKPKTSNPPKVVNLKPKVDTSLNKPTTKTPEITIGKKSDQHTESQSSLTQTTMTRSKAIPQKDEPDQQLSQLDSTKLSQEAQTSNILENIIPTESDPNNVENPEAEPKEKALETTSVSSDSFRTSPSHDFTETPASSSAFNDTNPKPSSSSPSDDAIGKLPSDVLHKLMTEAKKLMSMSQDLFDDSEEPLLKIGIKLIEQQIIAKDSVSREDSCKKAETTESGTNELDLILDNPKSIDPGFRSNDVPEVECQEVCSKPKASIKGKHKSSSRISRNQARFSHS
jgi:hypothetical protein